MGEGSEMRRTKKSMSHFWHSELSHVLSKGSCCCCWLMCQLIFFCMQISRKHVVQTE